MSLLNNKGTISLALGVGLISAQVDAGDINFKPKIDSTGYIYESKKATETEFTSNQAIVVIPSLLSTYSSKAFTGSVLAKHTQVEQKKEAEGADKSYDEFQYNGQLTLIEHAMFLSFRGSQSFRVISQAENEFGDKLLSIGKLTEYQTNGFSFNFKNPNPRYLGFNAQSSYNESKSEESADFISGINNKTNRTSFNLYQGSSAKNYKFNISAQHSKSQRRSFNDFESKNLNASLGFTIADNTDLVLVGSIDEYDIDISEGNNASARRSNLDTNSYGAGFEWNPRAGRMLRVTYNQLEEFSGETQFVGLTTQWEFSSRTVIDANLSKKFYGDAFNFSLSQNLKNFRLSARYNEDVTSYANLSVTSTPQLFVCTIGATDLSECFQPNSSSYVLEAGEGFLNVNQFETDITEQVFLRKSGSINLGYDKRRTKISLNAKYGKTEYLESDRETANRSVNLKVSYQLGKRSNVGFNASISRRGNGTQGRADKIKSIGTNFSRNLSSHLNLDVSARFIERESNLAFRNIVDKRLTAGLVYTF